MKKFLVGIDGSKTPDPAYWRDRNAFITADSAEEAKEKWIYLRVDWIRNDEIPYIQTREIPIDFEAFRGSEYSFTKNGIKKAEK